MSFSSDERNCKMDIPDFAFWQDIKIRSRNNVQTIKDVNYNDKNRTSKYSINNKTRYAIMCLGNYIQMT